MLLEKKETTLAYRCPTCGATVLSLVGIFALSGDMLKLRCKCRGSEATLTYADNGRIRLRVPCIACPKPHYFTIGQNSFFSREEGVFRLPCPYTGIDICFIGRADDVSAAVEQSNRELLELMKSSGIDDMNKLRPEDEDDDTLKSENPLIEDIVFYMLKELDEEGAIHCCCPPGIKGKYSYRLHHGRVTVTCEKCSASATLPMSGVNSAESFLEINELNLE